uniref:Small ribosomal subunit protein uS3c n=1 Tax=Volvocales sp. NrCl902 TaxID=2682054 RepID=A0A7G1GG94_9CHLO|nr:ribosomal protein S3 [Volvocales sp. NrCl902]
MGQKVHPIGFRIGITKKQQSQWFARFNKKKYAFSVLEDRFIRQTLTNLFNTILNNKKKLDMRPEAKGTGDLRSLKKESTGAIVGSKVTGLTTQRNQKNLSYSNTIDQKGITGIKIERTARSPLFPSVDKIGIVIQAENCQALFGETVKNFKNPYIYNLFLSTIFPLTQGPSLHVSGLVARSAVVNHGSLRSYPLPLTGLKGGENRSKEEEQQMKQGVNNLQKYPKQQLISLNRRIKKRIKKRLRRSTTLHYNNFFNFIKKEFVKKEIVLNTENTQLVGLSKKSPLQLKTHIKTHISNYIANKLFNCINNKNMPNLKKVAFDCPMAKVFRRYLHRSIGSSVAPFLCFPGIWAKWRDWAKGPRFSFALRAPTSGSRSEKSGLFPGSILQVEPGKRLGKRSLSPLLSRTSWYPKGIGIRYQLGKSGVREALGKGDPREPELGQPIKELSYVRNIKKLISIIKQKAFNKLIHHSQVLPVSTLSQPAPTSIQFHPVLVRGAKSKAPFPDLVRGAKSEVPFPCAKRRTYGFALRADLGKRNLLSTQFPAGTGSRTKCGKEGGKGWEKVEPGPLSRFHSFPAFGWELSGKKVGNWGKGPRAERGTGHSKGKGQGKKNQESWFAKRKTSVSFILSQPKVLVREAKSFGVLSPGPFPTFGWDLGKGNCTKQREGKLDIARKSGREANRTGARGPFPFVARSATTGKPKKRERGSKPMPWLRNQNRGARSAKDRRLVTDLRTVMQRQSKVFHRNSNVSFLTKKQYYSLYSIIKLLKVLKNLNVKPISPIFNTSKNCKTIIKSNLILPPTPSGPESSKSLGSSLRYPARFPNSEASHKVRKMEERVFFSLREPKPLVGKEENESERKAPEHRAGRIIRGNVNGLKHEGRWALTKIKFINYLKDLIHNYRYHHQCKEVGHRGNKGLLSVSQKGTLIEAFKKKGDKLSMYQAITASSLCDELPKGNPLLPQIILKFYNVQPKSILAKASIVADSIVDALEKRKPFRKVLKTTRDKIMIMPGIKGVKIMVSGRLNGAEIARSEWVRSGRVPLQTLKANIDYCYKKASTIYGIIGVKVWIFKE